MERKTYTLLRLQSLVLLSLELIVLCLYQVCSHCSYPYPLSPQHIMHTNCNNMTTTATTYIPFQYSSFTKPRAFNNNLVFENLRNLPWVVLKDDSTILSNVILDLPENAKLVHNNDETFVIKTTDDLATEMMSKYQKIVSLKLTISALKEEYLFNPSLTLKEEFLKSLDAICDYSKISIIITNNQQDIYDIILVGYPDNIKSAENKTRIVIDQLNPVIYIDTFDLETVSLLPLIAGIEFNNFKQVAKQTNCHLYLPNILPNTYQSDRLPESQVYITGLKSQVLLTKNLLNKIKRNISSPLIKRAPLDFNKKTMLLLMGKQEQLLSIMYNNECFIQLPGLDSKDSVLLFQANNLDAIEKSIEDVVHLVRDLYGVVCDSSDIILDADTDKIFLDMCSYGSCLLQVKKNQVKITGFKDEVKRAISLLSNYQLTMSALQRIHCVRYNLELNNKEREFIGGKKNGKLLKIMNTTNSMIKIIPFSDFSFVVELACQTIQSSIVALQMIEDELPTSLTFNIPESFHRQIIGVGGSTVQTIMRRYNVFIKFSNTFVFNETDDTEKLEFNQIESFIRKSNVIIKCPSKNGTNIPYAKLELEKLVQNCSNLNYFNTFIKLSRSHWRLLSNNSIGINNEINPLNKNSSNSTFITDLEKKTNTLIKFPKVEPLSLELLEIKGVESNSQQCANFFEKLLPKDYEFKLAYNPVFADIASFDRNSKNLLQNRSNLMNEIGFKFLNEISVPFKLLYNIEVQVFYNPKLENDEEDLFNNTSVNDKGGSHYKSASLSSTSGRNFINDIRNHSPSSPNFEFSSLQSNDKEVPQFHSILLSFFEEEVDKTMLNKCLELLTTFLRDNKIIIIDKNFNDNKGYIIEGSSALTNQKSANALEFDKENINLQEPYSHLQLPQNPLPSAPVNQFYKYLLQQEKLTVRNIAGPPSADMNRNWGF